MGLQAPATTFALDFRDISATKEHTLGTRSQTEDGRVYRYALAGATNLDPGKVTVAAAHAANHVNVAVAAAVAVGAKSLTATLGATAAAEDLYADGYAVINDAAGEGISYAIETHAAVLSSGVITATLSEPVKVALTTSSEVSFIKNPYASVVIAPGAVAHRAVGVPNVAITAAYYGWLQTGGDCSVLSDGVIGKGSGAILSDAVNGALEVEVAGTVTQRVGFAPEATVDTEYRAITLMLDN
jgi:hypothetical protein